MSERVAVIGVGQTHHKAKRDDVSIAGLVREAALRALDDAGLGWYDIDAVVIGKAPDMFEGVMMPELYLAAALGAVGKPIIRVHTAGSRRRVDGDRRRPPRDVRHPRARADRRVREAVGDRRDVGALGAACRSRRRSSPAPAATSRRSSGRTCTGRARRVTSA